MNGRRLATVEQVARVKDSDKKVAAGGLPEEGALWREYGGEEIAHTLQYLDLVDARYLISLHEKGGNLPCWQAMPVAARINRQGMWRLYGWSARNSLGILVLSYPWLDIDQ